MWFDDLIDIREFIDEKGNKMIILERQFQN